MMAGPGALKKSVKLLLLSSYHVMNTGKYGNYPRRAPERPPVMDPGPEYGQGIAVSIGSHLLPPVIPTGS
jgi:hypothetical protein